MRVPALSCPSLSAFPGYRTGALGGVLKLHGIADGILDAGVLARYEMVKRPHALQSREWAQGLINKIDASVAALEASAESLERRSDIGSITVGCALGYLDFRFADRNWRSQAPKLARWWEGFGATNPMRETMP